MGLGRGLGWGEGGVLHCKGVIGGVLRCGGGIRAGVRVGGIVTHHMWGKVVFNCGVGGEELS